MEDNNLSLDLQILEFLKKHPEGVNHENLLNSLSADSNELVDKLNSLIENNRVTLSDINGETVLKYRSEREAAKFRDLNLEEVQTYEIILASGSNGITTNELKTKTMISTNNLINKILKKLEKKLLIKSFKMIGAKSKKVNLFIYINYN
jgi:hypothetical protein